MRRNYILLFVLFPFISFAQTSETSIVKPDFRLIEAYGEEYIEKLSKENPVLIKRWNFYLDNAFFITDEIPEKSANYKSVNIENLNDFNILIIEKEQDLTRDWEVPAIYKIEGTEKLLIYHSGKVFNEKLKAFLNSK